MTLSRRGVIWILLFFSSAAVGQLLLMSTAPIHEFGHYVVSKRFGWNITDINWFSYIEYSQETIDNAPRMQKIFVNIAGVIFAPIIPYIISTRKKSVILEVVTLPYFVLGIVGSVSDIKKLFWYLLTDAPMATAENNVLGVANLMVSILTVLIIVGVVRVVMNKYLHRLSTLSIIINNLDDIQEGK